MKAKLRIAGLRWRERGSRLGKWTAILVNGLLLGAVEAPAEGQIVCKKADSPCYALVIPSVAATGPEAGIAPAEPDHYGALWGRLVTIALAAEAPLLIADLLDAEDFEVRQSSYRMVSVGRVDDGGDTGLLFQDQVTEQLVLLHRNGGVRIEPEAFPALSEAGYRVVGFRDFDGERSLDLVWENQATEQVAFSWVSAAAVIEDAETATVPADIRTTAAMLRYRGGARYGRGRFIQEAVVI